MKRILYIVVLVELSLVVLLPVGAWLASVLGCDIQNPVSEDGVRWLFQNGVESLIVSPKALANFVLLLLAAGAVRKSQLLDEWIVMDEGKSVFSDKERVKIRKARKYSCFFLLISLACLILPLFVPHSPLLGVTGSIIPSPWFTGIWAAVFLNVVISSIIYSAIRGSLGGVLGISRFFTIGIRLYGEKIVVYMLFSLIMAISKFCLG